jgi:hypothetical protein
MFLSHTLHLTQLTLRIRLRNHLPKQTDDTLVMRVSSDSGATFGPILMLTTNGIIGEVEGTDEG